MSKSIKASVQYLLNDQTLAVYKASVAGGELIPHEGNYSTHTISIENVRLHSKPLDLDREGFNLVTQTTNVTDFYDDSQLPLYESEIKILLTEMIKASDVLVFDHTRRSSSALVRASRKIREASTVIHNDYSSESGYSRLKDFIANREDLSGKHYLDRDFAIINVWRSINGTVRNHPLAMCFADSVPEADLIPVKREGKERMGEIQLMLHGNSHRWGYFPNMKSNEALLFKTFDSRTDGRTRFTPHTSFEEPDVSDGTPARESIETRCFVFF